MGGLSPWHWALVALAFLLLFGARRLPDAARGLGQSLRIFKAEMGAASDGDKPAPTDRPAPTPRRVEQVENHGPQVGSQDAPAPAPAERPAPPE